MTLHQREQSRTQGPPSELLLGRPEFSGDLLDAARWLGGKRVLVTGAAGSVGTPLSRLLVQARLDDLVLVDHHEYSLFTLERSLGRERDGLGYELADVRDGARLRRTLERHKPNVVIHLAAAKHVGYGERFPEGAVHTNVLATAQLLELARQSGVETFVYPSSDKSVAPPSLYGATKRITEALVQSQHGKVVRYVNIIGTRGSVIEIFSNQVRAGQPLSVTDERMSRYWISMDEALWSLLVTGRDATPGEVWLPECGDPVQLLETARRLAGWFQPDQQPYPITVTGMAPGERLHEVLLSPNELLAEVASQGLRPVRTARAQARVREVPEAIDELRELVSAGEAARLKHRCLELAEALQ